MNGNLQTEDFNFRYKLTDERFPPPEHIRYSPLIQIIITLEAGERISWGTGLNRGLNCGLTRGVKCDLTGGLN